VNPAGNAKGCCRRGRGADQGTEKKHDANHKTPVMFPIVSDRIARSRTVIEGDGDVNTWQGRLRAVQSGAGRSRESRYGHEDREEIAAGLRQKFPVFTKEELLAARLRPPSLFELRRGHAVALRAKADSSYGGPESS
jgi:hypothetical protein